MTREGLPSLGTNLFRVGFLVAALFLASSGSVGAGPELTPQETGVIVITKSDWEEHLREVIAILRAKEEAEKEAQRIRNAAEMGGVCI